MIIQQAMEFLKTPQFILAAIVFGIPLIIFQIAMFFSVSERGRGKVMVWMFITEVISLLLLLASPYILTYLVKT